MPKLPRVSKPSPVLSAALLAAAVAALSGCSSPQHASTTPGTTPAVWTPLPVAAGAPGHEPGGSPAPAGEAAQALITILKDPNGAEVAKATFEFNNGYATVTIATLPGNHLAPGFHGVHIHKVGKCEPNSVGPNGGAPSDFASAGDHLQVGGHSSQPPSGDLSLLHVQKDGTGTLVTTTDAFGLADLTTGDKTAIIIHAGADAMPNGGMTDQMPMSPGDAGKRAACGRIGSD
jgi:superoxide dismutase, Cu-Zn family